MKVKRIQHWLVHNSRQVGSWQKSSPSESRSKTHQKSSSPRPLKEKKVIPDLTQKNSTNILAHRLAGPSSISTTLSRFSHAVSRGDAGSSLSNVWRLTPSLLSRIFTTLSWLSEPWSQSGVRSLLSSVLGLTSSPLIMGRHTWQGTHRHAHTAKHM